MRNAIPATVLLAVVSAACSRSDLSSPAQQPRPVRVVHVVAADLFPAGEPPSDNAPGVQALRQLMDWIASGEDVDADALVLVGDLGLTPPAAAPDAADLEARAKIVGGVLAQAPRGLPMYVVPGGRRLAAPTEASQVLAGIQQQIQRTGATIVDLTNCYVAASIDASKCAAPIPGQQVRLVGFPAFAYADKAPQQTIADQEKWTAAFKSAVAAADEGWQTIVVAQLMAPVAQHWPSDAARTTWVQAAREASAGLGVIAPDAPRARYERNEPVVEAGLEGPWFPTPPLVSNVSRGRQRAEGASVITVRRDGAPEHRVFWYAPGAAAFRGAAPRSVPEEEGGWLGRSTAFLWGLGNLSPLARTALFVIAMFAALLTVVAVWQIPPSTTSVTAQTPPPATPAAGTAPAAGAVPPAAAPNVVTMATTTFLSGNFARTAISGLGGLAVAMLILDALWTTSKAEAQGYYVVWFVVWFVVLLIASSVFRGLLEGVRAYIVATPPARTINVGASENLVTRAWTALSSWVVRTATRLWWSGLVAGDVMFNVVQGRNDVEPAVLGKTIRELQVASLQIIDRIRESLADNIEHFVESVVDPVTGAHYRVDNGDIRVSVSVLAEDEKRTFYVSAPEGSLATEFGIKSVAWVAITGGESRWWVDDQATYPPTLVLFDNTGKQTFPDQPESMTLEHYFMARKADYAAFIVIPIPLRQRTIGQRRAGLHISFKRREHMSAIWDPLIKQPYIDAKKILEQTPDGLRPVLKQGIEVIHGALRHFNEVLFMNDRVRR